MEEDNDLYGGFAYTAKYLTEQRPEKPLVTRQGVWMWWSRREDFPRMKRLHINGRVQKVFDVQEVLAWYDNYVPAVRGRNRARILFDEQESRSNSGDAGETGDQT